MAYRLIPPAEKMAGCRPAIFRCGSADRVLRDSVAVGGSVGLNVVLKRAGSRSMDLQTPDGLITANANAGQKVILVDMVHSLKC
jgi:hypothetical protein